MKIYKIWQTVNRGYDTFSSAIVVAENEEDARMMTPERHNYGKIYYKFHGKSDVWAHNVNDVKVEYIGEAKDGVKKGVIIGSFNAG